MAKKFAVLREQMPVESQQRAHELAQTVMQELKILEANTQAMSRLCVSCGNDHMQHETRNLTFTHKGQSVTVEAVEGWYCLDCGETYLDDNGRYAETCAVLVKQTTTE